MVIHDMRNPTNSIQQGLIQAISQLGLIMNAKLDHEKYFSNVEQLKN